MPPATAFAADKKAFDCSRFGDLDTRMAEYRDTGFADGRGSRSTSNLAYRGLRRINIDIPNTLDVLEDECIIVQESIG